MTAARCLACIPIPIQIFSQQCSIEKGANTEKEKSGSEKGPSAQGIELASAESCWLPKIGGKWQSSTDAACDWPCWLWLCSTDNFMFFLV